MCARMRRSVHFMLLIPWLAVDNAAIVPQCCYVTRVALSQHRKRGSLCCHRSTVHGFVQMHFLAQCSGVLQGNNILHLLALQVILPTSAADYDESRRQRDVDRLSKTFSWIATLKECELMPVLMEEENQKKMRPIHVATDVGNVEVWWSP